MNGNDNDSVYCNSAACIIASLKYYVQGVFVILWFDIPLCCVDFIYIGNDWPGDCVVYTSCC